MLNVSALNSMLTVFNVFKIKVLLLITEPY